MRSTVREEEKEKEKGSSSGGKKLLKGIVKGGRKVIAGRSSHSDKSSAVDNASLRDPQSPTTSAPSPNPSATRQPLQETMATPNSYSIQGPTSVVPGDQVAPVQRKIPSNTNAFPNASQLHSRSAQDVQSSSTPRQNIAGMEKHQILPTMGPRNDSHQGTTSSLERFRTNGLDSRPLPGLPYPNMGGQFSSSAESALQGSRQHGREQAGSVGVNGIGETGAALSSPFSGPVDISLRRADTLDNFTPKGTTPSATWPHPPTDYTQAQIQDLQSRLQRAEEDRLRAQEEAESLKTSSLTAVRDARSQTKAAHNQIFAIEESLKKEMLQASSKSADMLSTIQQKEAALAEAERNFEEIQKNMEQVYNDLDKAQDECRQLQEAEKEQLDTITRLNGDFGPHLSNDHFQKLLKDLRTDIQIWAEDFFKGTIEEGRLSPNAFLANVSDDCNEYLRSPIMRPKLVQAYVWSVLNSSVFASNERNNPGLWWAHTRQAQLCGLRALLQPTGRLTQFHCISNRLTNKRRPSAPATLRERREGNSRISPMESNDIPPH
jgi:hypothetical protein